MGDKEATYLTSWLLLLLFTLSNIAPAIAIAQASMKAALNVFTSNPLKKKSAILITTAVTIIRVINVSRNKVIKFNGNLNIKPTVAFNKPITRATDKAVA
jgi:glucan phosphoethanolaminetransferase (alkaline phosphatase superfamily)